MATSGVITSKDTVAQIIRDALIELQVLSANQQPSANDAEMMRRRLNWMLKDWQSDGLNLWRLEEATITVPADTHTVDLDDPPANPRMIDVSDVRVVVSADNERPLQRMEWGTFVTYPNKTAPGQPTIWTPVIGLDSYSIRVWPVPTVDTDLVYSGARVIEDIVELTENIDVPQQYTRTVMLCLAAAAAPAFGRANDPNGVVVIREAARLYQIMRANDRPSSYFLQSARG